MMPSISSFYLKGRSAYTKSIPFKSAGSEAANSITFTIRSLKFIVIQADNRCQISSKVNILMTEGQYAKRHLT